MSRKFLARLGEEALVDGEAACSASAVVQPEEQGEQPACRRSDEEADARLPHDDPGDRSGDDRGGEDHSPRLRKFGALVHGGACGSGLPGWLAPLVLVNAVFTTAAQQFRKG